MNSSYIKILNKILEALAFGVFIFMPAILIILTFGE